MTTPKTHLDRQALRKQLRQARNNLDPEQQSSAAQGLLASVLQANIITEQGQYGFYLANDGELSPEYLIQHCWSQGINTSLPVLHPFTPGHLLFLSYSQSSLMQKNRYGIAEPLCEMPNVIPVSAHSIIFTPLVGFDSQGNRLGMGGGYYDRTLAALKHAPKTAIIGLAHDCQEVSALPCQSWDIPLDMIITPSRIIKC